MAGSIRSNLPSRLRQLLAGEGPSVPIVKVESETPSKVKAFIDKVIECPLQDIAIPLSGFSWEYNKGNFHHWRPLFLHFDTYFKTYLSSRKDLLLTDNLTEDDNPFPKQSVLQILHVMRIILENCDNKGSFSGLEHFKLLLASTDPDILIATLETLSTLVKINPSKPHKKWKLIACGSINSCLLSLAQGWGSKEEGLGLYSSIKSNERTHDHNLPSENGNSQNRVGSTLYFESHGTQTIHIPDLHLWKEDDLSIMKQLVEKYNVPVDQRFLLLTRIRYAHSFHSSEISRMYSKICLLAFIVLVLSSDSNEELSSLFANEPEYINELIKLVKSEETISPSIRALAVNALGSLLASFSSSQERARILAQSSGSTNLGNRMILLDVLQRAISSLNNNPSSIPFVESLLQFYLLQVISTSSPGSVIRGSGIVPTFLPLLEDTNPTHSHLVCIAVKTLQKLMDYSNSAVTLFRDLNGVDLLTKRLDIEVARVIDSNPSGDDMEVSSTNEDLVSSQKRVIRVLLKTLGCAIQNGNDDSLPAMLVTIFKNVDKFGGDVYSSTVDAMCDLIHNDPTCYTTLEETDLPNVFLSSVTAGVLPSSKAITSVPNGIAALCLNAKGLELVKETSALRFLIDVFTLKKYAPSMKECIIPLSNAVEELMRHVTSLKPTIVDLIIEIINKIGTMEDNMEIEEKENEEVIDSKFIRLCIFHVMVLVHKTMENTESCRLFVEKNGIEAFLKLLLKPSVTQSTVGMSFGVHSTMVFKSFTQHHSAPLARAFCSSLRDYLKTALAGFKDVSGSFLLDPKSTPDSRIFPSLFLIEFLLFLAGSKDHKWVVALLQEFGNGSKDILEDIGRIHREILWQISLHEDAKFDTKDDNDTPGDADVAQSLEAEEQRLNSFRQLLDPLMRRRTSGSNFESQFLDLINLYCDMTQSTSSGQRSTPSGQRSHPTGSLDMMRSLSLHITHLFQELGKAMILPSRRREEVITLTPSSKSVASVIASVSLSHLNFNADVASTSAKCRYLAKVVEFINGILLAKPDSCNPVVLNSLCGFGVVKLVLTTFEASVDLFTAPMETDGEVLKKNESKETVNGLLVNYGRLMDHLVTSSFILSSSQTHLLSTPLAKSENGYEVLPSDPEAYMKVLQNMVMKCVLPVWKHPSFTECSDDFISSVISIICNVFSGVDVKNLNMESSSLAPLNEETISMIVEMGFSRTRAEEALREVGSDSVELATEWLFSHPEVVQEDDELAQALAMSLGTETIQTEEEKEKEKEKEVVELPAVDDLLSTLKNLLETKPSLAFPIHDLLLMICYEQDGQHRSNVGTFILEQIKVCSSIDEKDAMLSSLFHVLALLLNDDEESTEVAKKSGLVKIATDLLSNWNNGTHESSQVPKWVTAAFLSIDQIFQVKEKPNTDISELLKKDDSDNVSDTSDIEEQKKLVEISCGYLKSQLPSETVHAILQLCSTLTRTHSVSVTFLNSGGLPLLLSLPSSSLFAGFDKPAGSIIRHVLEDPQTLQQAMESEIKQSVMTAVNRQASGRLSPRNFLTNLTSVISRDPKIFMQAALSVCQIETVGERPYVILLKDKDKEKEKEKEKEKSPVKNKVHRKPPQSFVNVIEMLLDSVMSFTPPVKEDESAVTDMEIDVVSKSENGGHEDIASMAKVIFILKMLTEVLIMYSPSVHVLLKRDNELSPVKGGVFHHILYNFLPFLKNNKKEKKSDVDWMDKLAVKASQFLVASCVRSTEARKRIFTEVNSVFTEFVNSSEVHRPPGQHVQASVDFLSEVLSARSTSGSLMSGEASVTFIDVGLVKSLTQTLKVLDLDNGDSLKVSSGVVKVLEVVTKEHLHAAEGNSGKSDEKTEQNGNVGNEQIGNENGANSGPTEGNDDMEHDEEDGDDVNEENDIRVLENGFNSVGIRFEIQRDDDQDSEDDDESMSEGDDDNDNDDDEDGDNDDDDEDDENNDLEEDEEEVHHLPHLDDSDQEDNEDEDEDEHEMDEYDEEMIEQEQEEDEDDSDDSDNSDDDNDGAVMIGLGGEMNGMDVLDQIEELGRDHGFSENALEELEIFGTRRQGRTTSIYNLLGRTRDTDTSVPSQQHPLLTEPSDTTPESDSLRLESVFRSLRDGRNGNGRGSRLRMWADDQQGSGTNVSSVPSGLEDLLVSQLTPVKEPEPVTENNGISDSVPAEGPEPVTENNGISDSIPAEGPEPVTENNGISDSVPAEGTSQESNESGAELGENIDVETGNNDGGDERETSTNGDMMTSSPDSVTEVSENPNQETEQGQIDPAFLEALPEELRAEVLSGRQVAQPANTEPQNEGDNNNENANDNGNENENDEIDPEFLAALPPDIREEVLAQQRAQGAQRSIQSEGQPVEMDTESIIATLPAEIREEVLLTSSDDVLSNLTPALVAEANMLRERFASRYNRTLSDMFPTGGRRGESSRANGVAPRRTTASTNIETSGAPLLDTEDLKSLIRLLRVVQPIYKPQLQRLLLNLCSHVNTRSDVVKILMDFLVLDTRKPNSNASEASFRLYSGQSHLMYSRPQSSDGVPPLVSRRVLETLTYLAKNHKFVAKLLLKFKIIPEASGTLQTPDPRGKAVLVVQDDETESLLSITLLLSLLKQPLYIRSITHLEQLLNLLDVIIDNAESEKESDNNTTKPSSSGTNQENESCNILKNLPQQELRLLCSLLASEGLSENAYTLVAGILKKLVAITPHHSHLFITELATSMKNLTPLAINDLHSFTEIKDSLTSTSNSDGKAILRVIQSLSSLVPSLNQQKENPENSQTSTSTLSLVSNINTALEPLWTELSSCITKIETHTNTNTNSENTPDESESITLPPGTQNILPYIESFFVTCEKLHFGQTETLPPGSDDVSTSGKVDEKNIAVVKFSEKHKKLLNAFIRQNPSLLSKSFAVILRVPRVIDFDNKRLHFRSKIKSQQHHHHGSLRVSVRRAYILEDSYNQLRMRTNEEMKGRLSVSFQGEEGIDAGGVSREWYQLLSRVIFDKGALLFTTVGNESTFQPNPNSVYQTEHLSYFKFIGRVVGKALFDGQLLDVHFTRSFYKHMLGAKVTYHDIEAIDPGYFKNLKWMLENDISDILDLTFSIDADEEKLILYEKGKVTDYELIPNGRNIRVTEENKHEYVDLIAEHRLTTAIRPQINAFLEGFNELVPREFISIFHDKELELLISGLPDIDLDDMRANTEYSGYSVGSPVIHWFWEVAQGLSKEDKARLLQFVTGTSKVPLEGFSALQGISGSQKFQIHKAYGSIDHLPSAHTCFNQLDLPEYPSKEHLEERLLLAIHEANEGFGFV